MPRKLTQDEFVEKVKLANPDIEIISEYDGRNKPIKYKCKICSYEGTTYPQIIFEGSICKGCSTKRQIKTHDVFLEQIHAFSNGKLIPISQYVSHKDPIKMKCSVCNGEFNSTPKMLLSGSGCPYCAGKKVLVGFNDLWTTHPDVASILENPDDGYKYTKGSNKSVYFECPSCHKKQVKKINNVTSRGFFCLCNRKRISFGERVFSAILDNLSLDYEHDKKTDWSCGKRYDFIINDEIICEIMGEQHYKDTFQNISDRTLEQEKLNDKFKKQLAIDNGMKYVAIDCSGGDFNSFKENILNSTLSLYIDLSSVDWMYCHKSIIYDENYEVANLWNDGLNISEISKTLKVSAPTVRRRLRNASEIGLCNYCDKI